MKQDSILNEHRKIIILLFAFSCVATYLVYNNIFVFGSTEHSGITSGNLTDGDIAMLAGMFAPLIAMSGSPFIALTVLSGAGWLLNLGKIDPAWFPYSEILMQMPISQEKVFITLAVITLLKYLLSAAKGSKVLCDATLSKLEDLIGKFIALAGTFLASSTTAVFAAEVTTASLGSGNVGGYIITTIISFLMSVFAFGIYIITKTAIMALDVLAFLFAPIPGATSFFASTKLVIVSGYAALTLINPIIASILGVIFLIAACIAIRAAWRLVY